MSDMELKKMQEIDATIAKLNAETAKLAKETFWYPVVVAGGIFATAFAIYKFILN